MNMNRKLLLVFLVLFFTYEGDDHNLSNNLNTAPQRSVDLFDKYLKN